MNDQTQFIQILYEISMSIGTTFDLEKMVKTALLTFMKKLNCSVGGVYAFNQMANGDYHADLVSAIPRQAQQDKNFQAALATMPAHCSAAEMAQFKQTLPLSGSVDGGHVYYVLDLPNFGAMILVTINYKLPYPYLKSLEELQLRFAMACDACLKDQALTQERNMLKTSLHDVSGLNRDYTRALETSADISRQITSILDLDELLTYVVNRLQNEFDFYHTHIYLVDEAKSDLTMVKGYGEVGQQLKAKGHRLRFGQGIVGTVAVTNEPFVSNWVDEVPNFVRNPLLPLTQSELAVPMRKGQKVLGVLDVQSQQGGRFGESDIKLLQSIGDQIAIAVDNARLLTEKQAIILNLQEVDRLKSEFLTTMSHELRTPLNAILGFADVLLQGIDGPLSDYAQNDVQLIYNSGQHLLTILNDILDISKIEAGMMELVLEPVEVSLVLQDVKAAATLLVKHKPIELIFDVPTRMPLIRADKTRLQQILMNLVDNAIKFTEKGRVTVRVTYSTESLNFMVVDTGIGIPEKKHAEIFERFKQGDMSRTRKYEGTGLGLTICRELVQLHGGKIHLRSQEGVGSEFQVTLPIQIVPVRHIV
jgi:signal transduction histidine kinase